MICLQCGTLIQGEVIAAFSAWRGVSTREFTGATWHPECATPSAIEGGMKIVRADAAQREPA